MTVSEKLICIVFWKIWFWISISPDKFKMIKWWITLSASLLTSTTNCIELYCTPQTKYINVLCIVFMTNAFWVYRDCGYAWNVNNSVVRTRWFCIFFIYCSTEDLSKKPIFYRGIYSQQVKTNIVSNESTMESVIEIKSQTLNNVC